MEKDWHLHSSGVGREPQRNTFERGFDNVLLNMKAVLAKPFHEWITKAFRGLDLGMTFIKFAILCPDLINQQVLMYWMDLHSSATANYLLVAIGHML